MEETVHPITGKPLYILIAYQKMAICLMSLCIQENYINQINNATYSHKKLSLFLGRNLIYIHKFSKLCNILVSAEKL